MIPSLYANLLPPDGFTEFCYMRWTIPTQTSSFGQLEKNTYLFCPFHSKSTQLSYYLKAKELCYKKRQKKSPLNLFPSELFLVQKVLSILGFQYCVFIKEKQMLGFFQVVTIVCIYMYQLNNLTAKHTAKKISPI